jgi:hypothetical protein
MGAWKRAFPILAAAAASAAPAQGVDDAGNRMVPLAAVTRVTLTQAETRTPIHCNAQRNFCLRAWRDGETGPWFLDLHQRVPRGANVAPAGRIALPPGDDPQSITHSIWPHMIRESSGALLFGVQRYRRAGFSGGGASETHLVLLRQLPGEVEASEVLAVQTGYTAMVRACFTEEEYRSRGACHDEFILSGTVRLAPGAAAGRPALALSTAARSYPRGARQDSAETPRLRRSDLVWEPDPACSYRRDFRFDAAARRYAPDRPLPDCSTYALP